MVVKSYSAVTFGGNGIRVYAPKNLRELYDFLLGKAELLPLEVKPRASSDMEAPSADFADVQGVGRRFGKGDGKRRDGSCAQHAEEEMAAAGYF